jgi:predicted esterase
MGTLSIGRVEVHTASGNVQVPLTEIASIQFGDADVVRTRQGKRVKGIVRTDDWTLREKETDLPLARADLRYIVVQAALGPLKGGQIVDGAAANGMSYHVRVPEKYDPKAGRPAIVVLHGSNAYSADYLLGITQRWPKIAADYVLIGIDGEWPTQKDPDGPPAFVYTYVDFVGRSKYKGFPGTDRESPALVAETLGEIRGQLKLTKVFVTGHSQGGFLAYSCLMNYPELFAGGMPISAGLIFQCEPTAYEDADVRRQQRKLPIVIVHGDKDPLVSVAMARSAYDSFLDDGFPMIRLLIAKDAGHPFIFLPFDEGIRWLESMTSDDPRALLNFAQAALGRKDYRDALAYLQREQELDRTGSHASAAKVLRQKIEQLAAAPARKLETEIREAKGNGWLPDFNAFRDQFEFTDAGTGVMAAYSKLRKEQEAGAQKLWADARQAFQNGDKARGYELCDHIVAKYFASSYYRYAKQTLDERR